MSDTISIFVASSYDEDRDHIIAALSGQSDFDIVGVEREEAGTIIKSAHLKPDVLILDLQLSVISVQELVPIVRRRSPSTAIVMLCNKYEGGYAGIAIKAGIAGFLLKETDTDKLALITKIVFSGGYYVSASIFLRVFGCRAAMSRVPGQETANENHRLFFSVTERGVITNIAKGFSDEQIARRLNLSAGTIRNCLTAVKRRTKLKNRLQIVVFSLVYGLINLDQLEFWKSTEDA
ncbi:MAG: response regulator transcription factor [Treponema sp.]|nr:response regulator transcription factor [Treponema sp.]